ncbi:TetR family transcriptional regulator [Microbacterium sp. STN6]|uniref:TetR/AcrR family transcriptional regulator n=1 Tax=Microbacterium sp. STN6 TaxID=2995588 RepID=UPI002260D417|nr:TetR/AcrR family transcriptional regulator [Microbacterium sp. STN6]MCX7522861.1 TetR family transcriptional regulator [Microbacterium sp. STN6]
MPTNAKANRGPSAGPANRAALVAAAREIFAEEGFAAPLSAVARRAGVGQGSLYRHFPDRIALAVAVFDDNLAALEALADDERSTLRDLFDVVTEQALESTALVDMLMSARNDARSEHLGTRVLAVIDAILARDQAAGRIRDHVEPADVMLAISMLASILSKSEPGERAETATRARAMFRAAFTHDA